MTSSMSWQPLSHREPGKPCKDQASGGTSWLNFLPPQLYSIANNIATNAIDHAIPPYAIIRQPMSRIAEKLKSEATVSYSPMIRDLPSGERPRERLRERGPGSLSNAELLAILLRVGTTSENVVRLSERLLAKFGGLSGLARASFTELCSQHGVGVAKASQIKAALEVASRLLAEQLKERKVVRSPLDVVNILKLEMGSLEQEHLRVVLLDTKNQVLGMPEIYKGSLNTSLVRIGEVFREAVRFNSAALVVVHNHPSGDPTPSPEDIKLTEMIVEAGRLLDIEVLDHLVIVQHDFVSLRERGIGFK